MQLIIVCETRASCKSDYKYIKSVLDYYYKERTFAIKKIFATNKSELIKKDNKIRNEINSYSGESVVILFADTDNNDNKLNDRIIDYVEKHNYDIVWMNSNIEEVFLGRKVRDDEKDDEADKYLIRYLHILPNLTNLSNPNPLNVNKTSNILLIFDKYLERK